jgi:hypothetical protein
MRLDLPLAGALGTVWELADGHPPGTVPREAGAAVVVPDPGPRTPGPGAGGRS